MGEIPRDIMNIAVMFITVAAIALVVSHYQGASTIIKTTGGTFGNLLSIVENPGQQSRSVMNTGGS